jgi:hypothetical protein
MPCPSRATSSRALRGVLCFLCVSCACVVTLVNPTHPPWAHPKRESEWRVGRTARMSMSFGYVADGRCRCCICFATRYARAPLGWRRAWSPRLFVWSSHVSFPLRPPPSLPLRAGNPPEGAHACGDSLKGGGVGRHAMAREAVSVLSGLSSTPCFCSPAHPDACQ